MAGGALQAMSNVASGSTTPTLGATPDLSPAPTAFGGLPDMIGQSIQNRLDQSPFVQAINSVTGMDLARPFTPSVPGQQPQYMEVASLTPTTPRIPESASDPNTIDYEPMLRKIAAEEGVNPDVAVRVANGEGGTRGWVRATGTKGGKTEPSYGPLQMLVGGGDTGYPEGVGNDFIRETGLDPRDPANAEPALRFALHHAAQNGWGAWYGAAKEGVGEFEGIRRGRGSGDVANPATPGLLTSSDPALKGSQPALVDRFQALQEAWGSPLSLNSAFRDAAKNAAVGGAKGSQHLTGNAIDINVRDLSTAERIALIRQASDLGFTGIGVYNNALHLDLGNRRNWGPSKGSESTPAWAKDVIAYHMGNTAADAKRPGARAQSVDMAGNPVPIMGPYPPKPTLSVGDRVKNAATRVAEALLKPSTRASRGIPQIDVSSGLSADKLPAVDLGAQDVAQSQANINAGRGPSQRSMARKQALQQRLRYQA